MSRQEYTEIDNYNLSEMLFNRDERLIEMIKGLREERDYIFNKLTCEKCYLQEKLNKKENRIDKAIEYIEQFENIKAYYSWLEDGYEEYNYDEDFKKDILNILRGEDDESN